MNPAALKAKLEDAKLRLSRAESVMEQALRTIDVGALQEKSMISAALGSALAEMKAARQDLLALEKVIADD